MSPTFPPALLQRLLSQPVSYDTNNSKKNRNNYTDYAAIQLLQNIYSEKCADILLLLQIIQIHLVLISTQKLVILTVRLEAPQPHSQCAVKETL